MSFLYNLLLVNFFLISCCEVDVLKYLILHCTPHLKKMRKFYLRTVNSELLENGSSSEPSAFAAVQRRLQTLHPAIYWQ